MNKQNESPAHAYWSLLICYHPGIGVTNMYANGLELGQIKDGVFMPNALFDKRNPLASADALAAFVRDVVDKLKAPPALEFQPCQNPGCGLQIACGPGHVDLDACAACGHLCATHDEVESLQK